MCQHVPAQSLETGIILAQPWFSKRNTQPCIINPCGETLTALSGPVRENRSKPASSSTRIENLFINTNIMRRAHSSDHSICWYDTDCPALKAQLFDILIRTINNIKIKQSSREWISNTACMCVCVMKECVWKANHRNLDILALCSQTGRSVFQTELEFVVLETILNLKQVSSVVDRGHRRSLIGLQLGLND